MKGISKVGGVRKKAMMPGISDKEHRAMMGQMGMSDASKMASMQLKGIAPSKKKKKNKGS